MRNLVILVCMLILSGCAHDSVGPLKKYLEQHNYTSFNPPRSADGAATIVDFKNGSESLVARAKQCLLSTSDIKVDRRDVAIAKTSYELTTDYGLELSLPKAILKDVDLAAAIGRNGVEKVSIALEKPFEDTISRYDVIQYLSTLAQNTTCFELFSDDDNLLLNQVLGVKGIEYSFQDKNNTVIRLTAEILNSINVSPALTAGYVGKSSLSVDQEVLIGYRAWQITESAGVIGSPLDIEELSSENIEDLRNASK